MRADLNWKALLRDIAIVYGLTALGGFLAYLATAPTPDPRIQTAASVLFGALGFAVAAWLTRDGRLLHLIVVSIGMWVVSALNILLGIPFLAWLLSIVGILPVMFLGLGLALLIERTTGRNARSDPSPL
jgi:hypothetical protein